MVTLQLPSGPWRVCSAGRRWIVSDRLLGHLMMSALQMHFSFGSGHLLAECGNRLGRLQAPGPGRAQSCSFVAGQCCRLPPQLAAAEACPRGRPQSAFGAFLSAVLAATVAAPCVPRDWRPGKLVPRLLRRRQDSLPLTQLLPAAPGVRTFLEGLPSRRAPISNSEHPGFSARLETLKDISRSQTPPLVLFLLGIKKFSLETVPRMMKYKKTTFKENT